MPRSLNCGNPDLSPRRAFLILEIAVVVHAVIDEQRQADQGAKPAVYEVVPKPPRLNLDPAPDARKAWLLPLSIALPLLAISSSLAYYKLGGPLPFEALLAASGKALLDLPVQFWVAPCLASAAFTLLLRPLGLRSSTID